MSREELSSHGDLRRHSAGALINSVGNYFLVRSSAGASDSGVPSVGRRCRAGPNRRPRGRPSADHGGDDAQEQGKRLLHRLPQGRRGGRAELGVELIWDGPTDPDPAKQNEVVDTWITRGVDVIAVAVENREGITSVCESARARDQGADLGRRRRPDARDFFVNQATPEGIGRDLMDNAARVLGGKGEFAIITASLTAANMIEWQRRSRPGAGEVPADQDGGARPCDDLQKKAFDEANASLTPRTPTRR